MNDLKAFAIEQLKRKIAQIDGELRYLADNASNPEVRDYILSLIDMDDAHKAALSWNAAHPVGTRVRVTSADGGFEAVTVTEASVSPVGEARVCLEPGSYWRLEFVEAIDE